jgi:nucleoside-diphosphate-sugar epimerase
VLQILNSEFGVIRSRIEPVQGPIESSCADMSLFHRLTGWTPPTLLEAGIGKIVEFEKERQGLASMH